MQIIRTLGQLGYIYGELVLNFIVGSVFQIEFAGAEQVSHQAVILQRFDYRFQIEGVFTISFSSMDVSGIVSVLLLQAVLPLRRVFHLTIGAVEIVDSLGCLPDQSPALYSSHAFTLYSSLI